MNNLTNSLNVKATIIIFIFMNKINKNISKNMLMLIFKIFILVINYYVTSKWTLMTW